MTSIVRFGSFLPLCQRQPEEDLAAAFSCFRSLTVVAAGGRSPLLFETSKVFKSQRKAFPLEPSRRIQDAVVLLTITAPIFSLLPSSLFPSTASNYILKRLVRGAILFFLSDQRVFSSEPE